MRQGGQFQTSFYFLEKVEYEKKASGLQLSFNIFWWPSTCHILKTNFIKFQTIDPEICQTSIQSVFGFVQKFQDCYRKTDQKNLFLLQKEAPSSTHLPSKILPGGVSLKSTESLLYFEEKQMLKRGRVYLKRFNYKSFIKTFINAL